MILMMTVMTVMTLMVIVMTLMMTVMTLMVIVMTLMMIVATIYLRFFADIDVMAIPVTRVSDLISGGGFNKLHDFALVTAMVMSPILKPFYDNCVF